MTSKSKDFDAKAFVDHMLLPTNTFLTVDPTGGYLTVGGKGDLEKAKKVWEKAGASVTTEQLALVRDLFAPKSSKTAAPVTGLQVWCMKCKVNVALKNPIAQIKNGKAMTKGECAQCGGPVYSFKAAPDTAAAPKDNPMTKADKVAFVKAHSKKSGHTKADATMVSNIGGMTEARLDKWIASWKAQEAGVKASVAKAEEKKVVAAKNVSIPMFRGHKLDRVEIDAAVTKAYKGDRPKGATIRDLYFMLGKEMVNPKFALHLVTGVSVQEFTQVMAARALARVGIECLEVK